MDIKTFKELSDLFQEVDGSWFLYQEQIVNIYGKDNYKGLIDEFEEFIKNIDSKDKPKLSLLFYSTLLVIQEDKLDEIADYCKDNDSLRYLKIGLNIFLKGKYSDIKYEIEMNISDYQYDYNDGDEISEEITTEVINIKKIIEEIKIDKRIELIVNYIFVENKSPGFFNQEIKNADIDLLLKLIRKQNHNKLSNIIKLKVFVNHRADIVIQKLFVDKML